MTEKIMARSKVDFPPDQSIGYLIRATYRTYIHDLEARLAEHDIPIGMWYFLRALWHQDGVTQRELSERVGSMGPTTAEQLNNIEARGYIVRKRSDTDRRKIHVHLTPKGRKLRDTLLPLAQRNNSDALRGFTAAEIETLRLSLFRIMENFGPRRANIGASRESMQNGKHKPVATRD